MREAVCIEDVARTGIRAVTVTCDACGRRGVYAVARLCQNRPRLRMTDFLAELTAKCDRGQGPSVYAKCQAAYGRGSLPDW